MPYSREELDLIESEWAYHLHGRSAFLSREDFAQLQAWDAQEIPAEAVIGALEAYFARRAKRAKPRTFVALAHLERDVAKAVKLRAALRRAEPEAAAVEGWETVQEPLASDPRARLAFEAWQRLRASAPSPDSPGYLEHFDAERQAHRALVALAEAALGPMAHGMQEGLTSRLKESGIKEGTLVWKRAWEHHWNRRVCEAWGIQG
jgi:hypothetical protein